jgi:hypothetical protein
MATEVIQLGDPVEKNIYNVRIPSLGIFYFKPKKVLNYVDESIIDMIDLKPCYKLLFIF